MKERSEHLYQLMQEDIKHCGKKNMDKSVEIECCYHICELYWDKLQKAITEYRFASKQEEIHFLKEIKPLFTSSIQYYSLLYQAELFKPPAEEKEKLCQFWERELSRLDNFIVANKEFYLYYQSGDTRQDEIYFIRTEASITTSYSHFVTYLLAFEKYNEYIEDELKNRYIRLDRPIV